MRLLLFVILVTFVGPGCNTLGPNAILGGREAYNEAIRVTENQQLLRRIVQFRYGEASGSLAVTSVTANLKFRVDTSAEFGIGADENYAGNLVPLSGGIAYEENPTISYVPVQGDKFVRQLLEPLPLDLSVLLLRSSLYVDRGLKALVKRANDLENPDFLAPGQAPDPRFARFAALLRELDLLGRLEWVQDESGQHFLFARSGADARLRELTELLGLPAPAEDAESLTVPVVLAPVPPAGGLALTTRSVWGLATLLSAAVDVPPEDLENGLAAAWPGSSPLASSLHIHRSGSYPDSAMIAIDYRDDWYYIADDDHATKDAFLLFHILWSVRIAEMAKTHGVPVLTVPVSG